MQAMFTRPLVPWKVTDSRPPMAFARSVMALKAVTVLFAVFSSVFSSLAMIFSSLKKKACDRSGHMFFISFRVFFRAKAYSSLFMRFCFCVGFLGAWRVMRLFRGCGLGLLRFPPLGTSNLRCRRVGLA